MKEIVAFIGRAGSGKDFQCSLLQEKGYKKLAFADSLREITSKALGLDLEQFVLPNYEMLKQTEVTNINPQTMRQVMENIGSAIRKIDSNFWIKALIKKIDSDKICISDMRYYNEYTELKDFCKIANYSYKVVFCDYHSNRYQENNKHESAKLSNNLVKLNYKDLQVLSEEDIIKAHKLKEN